MPRSILRPTIKVLQIGNARPIRIHYAYSIVMLDPTEIAGTDTTLRLEGQFRLEGNAPVTLSAVGAVDMQLLRSVQPEVQSPGKLLFDVRGSGATANPALEGQLRLQNIAMMRTDAPLGLQNLNGILDINNNQVNIKQLSGGCEEGGRGLCCANNGQQLLTILGGQSERVTNARLRKQKGVST